MKIALFGYGKMGKVIEQIAIQRGHDIILKIDKGDSDFDLSEVDVAIDFSVPEAAVQNITKAFEQQTPIISGTTGWLKDFEQVKALCKAKNGAFIYASNFSLGVNIFFELNKTLAKLMKSQSQYQVSMEETHHTQKQDAPSGTAITLAKAIIEEKGLDQWTLGASENPKQLGIEAKRIEKVPGTHQVVYNSEVDRIEIIHTAHNRQGFGLGAVVAAEWILGKQGIFSMKDVLNINS
jgi:4-hydroxy-tetrahydrodipicolinate reductase